MNYFEFLDLPVTLKIDQQSLKAKFLENSRSYHPDFHTQADQETQLKMLEMAALNNKAFKTLSDFDERILYVLQIKNVIKAEGQNEIPQDFLMEMMDINERLMDIQFDPSEEAKSSLETEIETITTNLNNYIQPLLEVENLDAIGEQDWKDLLDFHLKRRYIKRLVTNLAAV